MIIKTLEAKTNLTVVLNSQNVRGSNLISKFFLKFLNTTANIKCMNIT